jgi:hypothetical protein
VPWDKIPWQQLVMLADTASKNQFWQMIFGAASGASQGMSSSASPASSVNFFDPTIWSKAPFTGVKAFGWTNVPWAGAGEDPSIWGKIVDAGLLACMTQYPARSAELAKYATCFTGDLAKLKKYMCDPKLDVAKDCAGKAEPPVPIPPGFPTGINWSCSPSPQCLADQFKTLGVPDPCSPMPTCIPEWYKTITGQGLPTPKADEGKSDTNLPLYVGLGAAGIALVAGILVIAAAD